MPLAAPKFDAHMAYDEALAERIRTYLDGTPDVTERKMFGGLAFLIAGNMAIAVRGHGGLMVRVGTSDVTDLMSVSSARPVEMGNRVMSGWLHIDQKDLQSDETLFRWANVGTNCAKSLPAKR